MHGEEAVDYRHPALEPIFKETYGIPVYQEQIMRTAMKLAGYTASEADDLRKAIAKKKARSCSSTSAQVHRQGAVEQRHARRRPPRPSSTIGRSLPATASTKATPPITA